MKRAIAVVGLILCLAAGAYAQESERVLKAGKMGFSFYAGEKILDIIMTDGISTNTISYQGIAFVWHVTDSFAIEPTVFGSFKGSHYENKFSGSTDDDSLLNVGGALGLLYYSNLKSNLYMYIGPRVEYYYMNDYNAGTAGAYDEDKTMGYGGSLVFGMKYMFNEHVGVFGDISATYNRIELNRYSYKSSGGMISHTVRTYNLLSASKGILGVSLYF